MYTEEKLKELGIEQDELTEEELLVLLAALHITISDLEKEIRAFYQKYGVDGVISYSEAKKKVSSSNHTKRLLALNEIVANVFGVGFNEFERVFESHLSDIIMSEARFFGVDIDVDDILDTVWGADDLTWLKRLTAHRKRWTSQIAYDLKCSFLKQDSVVDVVTQLLKRGESMEKVLARLWRTESNAISSISRQRIFEKLGVTKYRFVHIDGCVCEECSDMNQRVFPLSEYVVGVTANPLHPNCKDITVPITE